MKRPVVASSSLALLFAACCLPCFAQEIRPNVDLTRPQNYTLHRASSTDPLGGNADSRILQPAATMTLLDTDGPGLVSHIWMTISDREKYHLKRIVLRIYWDNESSPSVETPVGDFFGLNLGDYHNWESAVLSVGNDRGMNCFFPMPFRKHARITLTNEGRVAAQNVYFNIDYRMGSKTADNESLYFHAQYRQAAPNSAWTTDWYANGDPAINNRPNKDGKDNYVFMEANGRGHYVGLTLGVLQNQDGWWGEGDDMLFIDDPTTPAIVGTGAEDYILGAWGFGSNRFSYQSYGAPIKGDELAGSRTIVYRFHLDSPVPFSKYFKGTIEHGHANHRTDNYYSESYWYQAEPHTPFPPLPPVETRLPAIFGTGGPGNGPQKNDAPPLPAAPTQAPQAPPSVATPPGAASRTSDPTTTPPAAQQPH
ncbi:MAG: DUF2961 domain-containing protein [Edaphobacter sp.]|uniref:glycoside hydrolase family 172 protein n=1 Tax=Edaphobacter sp. TaxID=1934404 RepID=UPI00238999F4|nr:DUF2961 domain-containing protein [Edaphobacter sp.]MDE1178141.1 DUF2961 domain-containing protein [Edaphobacter sp.]